MPTIQLSPDTQNVVFNGNEVDKVILNGTTVWEKFTGPVIELSCVSTLAESDENVEIRNKWSTPIQVSVNGGAYSTVAASQILAIPASDLSVGSKIEVKESSPGSTFRGWEVANSRPFVRATKGNTKFAVTELPSLNHFTKDADGHEAGNGFFCWFAGGTTFLSGTKTDAAIVSFPEGSLDTSNITTVWSGFFSEFNWLGVLTSLPAGSFDTRNIHTDLQGYMFRGFNRDGALTSLPAGSFRFDSLTAVENRFCSEFNMFGALTKLPTGSFNTSRILEHTQDENFDFMLLFNYAGKIPKSTTSYTQTFYPVIGQVMEAHYWNGTESISENVYVGHTAYWKAG